MFKVTWILLQVRKVNFVQVLSFPQQPLYSGMSCMVRI